MVLVASPSFGVPICKIRVTVAPQSVPQQCVEVKAIIRVEIVAGEATWELQVPGVSALGNYLSIGEGAGGQGFGDNTSGAATGEMAEEGLLGLQQGLCQFPQSRAAPPASVHFLSPPPWVVPGSFPGRNQGGRPALSRGKPCSGTRKQVGEVVPAP